MPNGHTGGFEIDRTELTRLITSTPQADVVASVFTGRSRLTPATGAELVRLFDQCQQERVYIEEQDHTHYIVHISDDPVIWIAIPPDSVLRPPVRARHIQQTLAANAAAVARQPRRIAATDQRRWLFVIGSLAVGGLVLLGWLLFWLGVFGQRARLP